MIPPHRFRSPARLSPAPARRPALAARGSRYSPYGGAGLELWRTPTLLGGQRFGSVIQRVAWIAAEAITNLAVVDASRANWRPTNHPSPLRGVVETRTVDGLPHARYHTTGGSFGAWVPLPLGVAVTVADGTEPSRWLRLTRAGTLTGNRLSLTFVDLFASLGVGEMTFTDIDETARAAGENRYRGFLFLARERVTGLKIWIDPLGPSAVSSAAQLGGSGSGSIGSAADAFLGWPAKGFCRVETSSNVLREIVYYGSRTASTLAVASGGRGLLGTSAAAGASTDLLYPVPGIRIAKEATTGSPPAIQTIANATTAPTGVTWSTAITEATGVSIGDLAALAEYGLWVHREIPAGMGGIAEAPIAIRLSYTSLGVMTGPESFEEILGGKHVVEEDALERYELRVGLDALPDLTADPDETFTSSPHTSTLTLTPDTEHFLVVSRRNSRDQVSHRLPATRIRLDGSADEIAVAPSAPHAEAFAAGLGGTFTLQAAYYHSLDSAESRADTWLIYLRTNGTDPDPSIDTPTEVAMGTADDGSGVEVLAWTSGSYSGGTTGKVLVRVRRDADTIDSESSAILTAVAVAANAASMDAELHAGTTGRIV